METYRITENAALYYLTFSVLEWLPVFISEEPCLIITESLNFCHREKLLHINAFSIMPTHMHVILFDAEFNGQRLQRTVTDFRKHTGRQLSDYCEQKMPSAIGRALRSASRTDRERLFWQQSRHAGAIYSHQFWRSKFDYLHDNPRRKGLVREPVQWRFSSAAFWLADPPGESDVILTAVEWESRGAGSSVGRPARAGAWSGGRPQRENSSGQFIFCALSAPPAAPTPEPGAQHHQGAAHAAGHRRAFDAAPPHLPPR